MAWRPAAGDRLQRHGGAADARGNEGDPALAGFCAAMAGCWLGFLLFNRHPARVFMGDTGSLAMGAALAAVALLSNSLWACS